LNFRCRRILLKNSFAGFSAKGKGEIDMYFVLRERVPAEVSPPEG
jgi:hypothetical protein